MAPASGVGVAGEGPGCDTTGPVPDGAPPLRLVITPVPKVNRPFLCWLVLALLYGGAVKPCLADGPCAGSLTQRIPARTRAAPGGREFMQQVRGLSDDEREAAILSQLLRGNLPQFLRQLRPVVMRARLPGGAPSEAIVCVSPDYLAVGSDADFVLVPMRLRTALTVATGFGFTLPTPKMVDAIYRQAPVHLQPQPLPASDTMRTSGYYWHHNELVKAQRLTLPEPLGALTAGDKKDLVLTNRLWSNPSRVAIYGWQQPDGVPIQPLSTVHGLRYADYSHGIRLVSAVAYVDGQARNLLSLLQDPRAAMLLNNEGAIRDVSALLQRLLAPGTTPQDGSPHPAP